MSLITCNDLTKLYGSKTALNKVSFEIQPGAPIALVGPNGAGKTTLFNLLCGFLKPSNGSVRILDQRPGERSLIGNLAALPQDSLLDPSLSISAQLSFFAQLQGLSKAESLKEADRVLDLVDLRDTAKEKPTALSHGMGKRVAIAQTFIGSPKLILLDEPTAGIDPANAKKIRSIVSEQQENTNFLISSHNLDELEKLCDQVLYLENGSLQQSISLKNQTEKNDFITLTMEQTQTANLVNVIKLMNGIKHVEHSQQDTFIIEYCVNEEPNLEIRLFEMFSQNKLQYKSILRGKRLEDTLFS
ncbi:ABC transporter ATP-binding protein [Parashewanella spongiae]|uniref:ABC transporter ATP-binding protein n=1 Tax=Parashewanella spongiae TaxID=342950 RepID=A0A3A6TRQ9_9GAMM|nr:ABC transporter ATP-binding protein [Parashewanella spongiae]MCL1079182.1 ABC transporter ATP-binding protein [Parashewanella spongiae]RJY10566.1 ABC transporter ATP-binding protein [Parashewanella spongiae]